MDVLAYAKINLVLEVLGRRDDGFHQVATVLQTIDLHDTLRLEPAPKLELACSWPGLDGPDNLVWQAATRLQQIAGEALGARISLKKRIPVAMGLGGGSSDAAAALMGLNKLWGLGLEHDDLAAVAAELGSDVSFFLRGGTALAEGRGEKVTPLPGLPPRWAVVLCPPCHIEGKTAQMYRMMGPSHYSEGGYVGRAVERLQQGQLPLELLCNVFEHVASQAFGDLYDKGWSALLDAGVGGPHLCGSGPAIFSLVASQHEGEAALNLLKDAEWEAYLVSTC